MLWQILSPSNPGSTSHTTISLQPGSPCCCSSTHHGPRHTSTHCYRRSPYCSPSELALFIHTSGFSRHSRTIIFRKSSATLRCLRPVQDHLPLDSAHSRQFAFVLKWML